MRISLSMRAARACAAAPLLLSLGFVSFGFPAAHAGAPTMRAGVVPGHGQSQVWRGGSQGSWGWRGKNGWNRFSRNSWRWNQAGLLGLGYWQSPYGFADAETSVAGDAPPVVIGAPAINVFLPAEPASFDQAAEGRCVILKLIYDRDGKYVGERQLKC
jgi:hypothetical protein